MTLRSETQIVGPRTARQTARAVELCGRQVAFDPIRDPLVAWAMQTWPTPARRTASTHRVVASRPLCMLRAAPLLSTCDLCACTACLPGGCFRRSSARCHHIVTSSTHVFIFLSIIQPSFLHPSLLIHPYIPLLPTTLYITHRCTNYLLTRTFPPPLLAASQR